MSEKIMKQHSDRLHQRAKMKKDRTKFLQCLAVIIALAFATWLIFDYRNNEMPPGSKIDPFSGSMVIEAPDCVITGPDGKSLKEAIREQSKTGGEIVIPKGTTFNSDCFPDAKAARAADSKMQENQP